MDRVATKSCYDLTFVKMIGHKHAFAYEYVIRLSYFKYV